jgi:hypothetical protein
MQTAKGHMTGQFQKVVKGALAAFVAEISAAAEREVIEAIRVAFARASCEAGDAVAAAVAPITPVPPSDQRRRRRPAHRTAARIDPTVAMRERVVACVREHPGWDPGQLARSLGIAPAKLRRRLRELVNDGTIGLQERPAKFGQGSRIYFVREHANAAHARPEPAAIPTEPPAAHVEAAA